MGLVDGTGPDGRTYNGLLHKREFRTGDLGYYFKPDNGPIYWLEAENQNNAMQEVHDRTRNGDFEGMRYPRLSQHLDLGIH